MAGTTADVVLRVRALASLVAVLLTTAGLMALVAPFLTPVLGGGPVASVAAPATDLDELLVLVCALLLLVGWAWLALGTCACLAGHLLRRPAGPATGRLRPTTARRLAAVLVGSSLVGSSLGGLAAAPAFARPFPTPDVPGGSVSSEPSTAALPLPGRPVGGRVAPTPSTPTTPTPTRPADRQVLVVRPGDSLWSLAAAHLLPRGRSASERAVDAAWRRLYAANRAVIGPDPHLIRPGARLDLPAPAPTEGLP